VGDVLYARREENGKRKIFLESDGTVKTMKKLLKGDETEGKEKK
jgi:hypothetical protein